MATESHGLTLGKFAPFHRGHQLLLETALAEVDHLTVIVYDSPDVTAVPLRVRCEWIRKLYPSIRVLEAWNGPQETGSDPRVMRLQEDYVINTLGITGITHFYSSEFYGEHMSAALGAIDRRVDPDRVRVPTSATMIRRDPRAHREWLPSRVYRDLVAKVVLVGGPSTGKTTLASALAAELGTVWMPEYGREYWATHQVDRRLTPQQLVEIAEGHIVREEALCLEANRLLIVDTNALTTYLFAHLYHGHALSRLGRLAEATASRYDLTFLCDDDMPYDDTMDRSGPQQRALLQRRTIDELHTRRIPYIRLDGTLEQRIAKARRVLEGFEKWKNLPDHLLREGMDAQ
jgi:NadR type nicotinamide-nucleotide adenylyltransferase